MAADVKAKELGLKAESPLPELTLDNSDPEEGYSSD